MLYDINLLLYVLKGEGPDPESTPFVATHSPPLMYTYYDKLHNILRQFS